MEAIRLVKMRVLIQKIFLSNMKNFNKRLQAAKQYINYNIKEGVLNEDDWIDLPDEEFIKRAEYEEARADYYANQ